MATCTQKMNIDENKSLKIHTMAYLGMGKAIFIGVDETHILLYVITHQTILHHIFIQFFNIIKEKALFFIYQFHLASIYKQHLELLPPSLHLCKFTPCIIHSVSSSSTFFSILLSGYSGGYTP